MIYLLSLLLSFSFASEAPAPWKEWVDFNTKELKKEFAGPTAKDLVHLNPKTTLRIIEDGKGSFEFSETQTPGRREISSLEWDGQKLIKLGESKIKFEAGEQKGFLKIPLTKVSSQLAVDGLKRADDNYVILFLYDPKRPGLDEIRQFKVFDYAPEFKVRAQYLPLAKPEPMTVPSTRGEPKKWQKFGDFKFTLQGQSQTLQVVGASAQSKMTMLMFHDLSNGDSTYKGGRFLDVKLKKSIAEMKQGDVVELDFNFSNNPVCARSAAFMCPVPLDRMNMAVLAGEKKIH